jgi:beta-glucosidase
MRDDLQRLLSGLSLSEKASLCSGADFWNSKGLSGHGVPAFMLTDGPHGLRKQNVSSERDNLQSSVPATCFPSGAGLAATWDPELLEEIGQAMGREAAKEDVGVILGPALNIKRSPLCGRNFEYYSEDPFLAGKTAAAMIRGIQSQGVGACPKHFAVNNQERLRMSIDARLDERTLREIYLTGFEIAVKEGRPWSIMSAYNKVNGVFCSQNRHLLADILRGEWGFDGAVITDWGADDDRVEGVKAGQDLEMPGNGGITDAEIVAAVEDGRLSMEELDACVLRVLQLAKRVEDGRAIQRIPFSLDEHHALARRAARECAVLLKNDTGLLPLPRSRHLAFLGAFAETPRYQGGGSSRIEPTRMDSLLTESRRLLDPAGRIDYAPGYRLDQAEPDPALIAQARDVAAAADAAVLFIGLPPRFESEGFDRESLAIPAGHAALLEAVASVQDKVIVVLSAGSAVEMPWIARTRAVLQSYLGGQAWGGAMADILFGLASPSGKLPETFPARLADVPCRNYFPGGNTYVEYREGVFVGYRHYDSAGLEPLFPFGHGLSYSRFEYGAPRLSAGRLQRGARLGVSIEVRNVGPMDAKETVQLYLRTLSASIPRPFQELKAFTKLAIPAGASAQAEFSLDERAFSYWDDEIGAWRAEGGDYELRIGSSSRDIRATAIVSMEAEKSRPKTWDMNSRWFEFAGHPAGRDFMREYEAMIREILSVYEPGSPEYLMTEANQREMPLRNILRMSRGQVSVERIERLLRDLNAG